VLIIVVFDPLAVLMLIAANQGLKEWRETKTDDRRRTEPAEQLPEEGKLETTVDQQLQESQQVTLNIEGKDELIAVVEGLRKEMAALNAAIAAAPAEPEPEIDFANLSGVAYSDTETLPEPVRVEPQNHTFSFEASTNTITVETDTVAAIPQIEDDSQASFDFDVEPEPEILVKPPIAADEIQPEDIAKLVVAEPTEPVQDTASQWQIIDTLPEPRETEAGKTVHDFLNELRDAHQQRIDRHLAANSDT